LLGVLLVSLYARISVKLVTDWYELPDFSHGFLIPFFVLFLLWDKRHVLRQTPVKPTWAGLGLVIFGLFVLLTGVFGADLFLSRFSFVLLTAGIIWTLWGKAMLHETMFLLFVLMLAIPLPTLVMNQITFPLQIKASELASALLPMAGVPVLRDGNVIQLPSMQLEPLHRRRHLRLLSRARNLAPGRPGRGQRSHRGRGERRPDLRNRAVRSVLEPG
jgi:hypothetical protein